jgi:hypothetical protein
MIRRSAGMCRVIRSGSTGELTHLVTLAQIPWLALIPSGSVRCASRYRVFAPEARAKRLRRLSPLP